jgi:hypothetical protein
MGIRLIRVIVGLLLLVTIFITIIPNIIVWIITGRSYLMEVIDWVVIGE